MIKTLAVASESLITKGGYAKQIQTKPELSEKHSFSLFYYHNVYSWYGNLALQNVIVMCNILGMIINVPHFLKCANPALDDIIEMDITYNIDSCGIITSTKKNNGIVPWLRNILFHYRLHIFVWCSPYSPGAKMGTWKCLRVQGFIIDPDSIGVLKEIKLGCHDGNIGELFLCA